PEKGLTPGGALSGTPALPVRGLAFSRDGKVLLTTDDREARLWDLPARRQRYLVGWAGPWQAAAFSPDGQRLAVPRAAGGLHLCELATWRIRRPPAQPLGPVRALTFAPDGRTLLSASQAPARMVPAWLPPLKCEVAPLGSTTETVRAWDSSTGAEVPL